VNKIVLKKSTFIPTNAFTINYEQELNEEQLQAVVATQGATLVIAGAGTGKTRTLTYRVARLVEMGADPASILLLTFTRKSAAEMLSRSNLLLPGRCKHVAGGTFHSFAHLVQQRFVSPEKRAKTILDQSDAQDVISLVRSRYTFPKQQLRFPQKAVLQSIYSTAINTVSTVANVVEQHYPQFIPLTEHIERVLQQYVLYKITYGLADYDDLLLQLLAATADAELGPRLRAQFHHVMVDEYQDTNALQHRIVVGLANPNGSIMAVGDDAQSIYSFRGAEVQNIHQFPELFPHCRVVTLVKNYRSTQPILDVANAVLEDAPFAFQKKLVAHRRDKGDVPCLVQCTNEQQQAAIIVQQVLEIRERDELSTIAILFRSGFLSFELELQLQRANIPFRKYGGIKFSEAAHVKDILAFLRISVHHQDASAWFRLLQLLPTVGPKTAQNILDHVIAGSTPHVSHNIQTFIESAKQLQRITDPLEVFQSAFELYKPLCELAYDDHQKRLRDLTTVEGMIAPYRSTAEFLTDIALDPPTEHVLLDDAPEKETEFLTLSTIHSAKGLEWKHVFVMSVNEGRIPSSKSLESAAQLEEERRLLYVACTRAKDSLWLLYPSIFLAKEFSNVQSTPSRFLESVSHDQLPVFIAENE
jgi:DNA helicase II / ATP-dependent DNA helicase PcrA